MKPIEPSLKYIAEKLNISKTTVSKALKDYKDVSPITKTKVLELAKSLNYTPNTLAVNLRKKETNTIGLIIPDVVHHFFSNIVKGIVAEAEKLNYLVIILQSNESKSLEEKQVELLINKRVDGIIMSLSNESNFDNHIATIIDRGIPLVVFDKINKLIPCSKVIIDDQLAAYNATIHLINQGCKKIAHIRGPVNPQNAIDRFLGYKKALTVHGLTYTSDLVAFCENVTYEEGYSLTEKLLSKNPDIDGIFCITDLVAVGVIAYCNDHNIKIPQQIAVIGFSNWFVSQITNPKLSTINQPNYEMGTTAFNLLMKEINHQKTEDKSLNETIVLETTLIERASSLRSANHLV